MKISHKKLSMISLGLVMGICNFSLHPGGPNLTPTNYNLEHQPINQSTLQKGLTKLHQNSDKISSAISHSADQSVALPHPKNKKEYYSLSYLEKKANQGSKNKHYHFYRFVVQEHPQLLERSNEHFFLKKLVKEVAKKPENHWYKIARSIYPPRMLASEEHLRHIDIVAYNVGMEGTARNLYTYDHLHSWWFINGKALNKRVALNWMNEKDYNDLRNQHKTAFYNDKNLVKKQHSHFNEWFHVKLIRLVSPKMLSEVTPFSHDISDFIKNYGLNFRQHLVTVIRKNQGITSAASFDLDSYLNDSQSSASGAEDVFIEDKSIMSKRDETTITAEEMIKKITAEEMIQKRLVSNIAALSAKTPTKE